MIDLHLSAFAPRWRFLYVVRIDAYVFSGGVVRGYLKKQKTALGNIAGSGLEVVYEQTDTSDLRPHECRRV